MIRQPFREGLRVFGDAVTLAPETILYPTLLDLPAPEIRADPRETVIAEKLEAMVKLGRGNSRMKRSTCMVRLWNSLSNLRSDDYPHGAQVLVGKALESSYEYSIGWLELADTLPKVTKSRK